MRWRPTHFLALRIMDASVRDSLHRAQQDVVRASPHLAQCAVPIDKSHLTLFVFRCDDDAQAENAVQALLAASPRADVEQTGYPWRVTLNGMASFDESVLYARVEGEALGQIQRHAQSLHRALADAGVDVEPWRERWNPHVTLLKTSRVKRGKRKRDATDSPQSSRRIPRDAWESLADTQFGTACFQSVDLCSMRETQVLDDGVLFYRVLARQDLSAA